MDNELPPAQQSAASLVTSTPFAILVAAAMISGSILYSGFGASTTATISDAKANDAQVAAPVAEIKDPGVLLSGKDAVLGSNSAPVTIVEFSDFQCPFCRSFFEGAYAQIKKDYIDTGKVKVAFRHYPLPFHSAARPSALAAECAAEQGKFWQLHDKMFLEQAKKGTGTISYGTTELKQWAAEIGLTASKFNSCLDNSKYASKVDADIADGAKYGVSGTPSFFVNGKQLVGAQPFEKFKALIDSEL